jgi:hypothetical protein
MGEWVDEMEWQDLWRVEEVRRIFPGARLRLMRRLRSRACAGERARRGGWGDFETKRG